MSLRTLFRAIDDGTREWTGVREDADYADLIRRTTASLLERMGSLVREFGEAVTAGDTGGDGRRPPRLPGALEALRSGRTLVQNVLIGDPRSDTGLWELNSALLTTVDRLLDELGPPGSAVDRASPAHAERARQAAVQAAHRLRMPRRPGARRPGETSTGGHGTT